MPISQNIVCLLFVHANCALRRMLVRTLVREKLNFFVGKSPTHPIPGDKYWFVEKMHDIPAGW
jgi:hypothetical protein